MRPERLIGSAKEVSRGVEASGWVDSEGRLDSVEWTVNMLNTSEWFSPPYNDHPNLMTE